MRNPNSTLTDSDWTGPAVRFLRLPGDSELGDFGGELFEDGWAIQSTVNLWYNHLLCFLISFLPSINIERIPCFSVFLRRVPGPHRQTSTTQAKFRVLLKTVPKKPALRVAN